MNGDNYDYAESFSIQQTTTTINDDWRRDARSISDDENLPCDPKKLDEIPLPIRNKYGDLKGRLMFKVKRGFERTYLILTSSGFHIAPRFEGTCQTRHPSVAPLGCVRRSLGAVIDFDEDEDGFSENHNSSYPWNKVVELISIRKQYLEVYLVMELSSGTSVNLLIPKRHKEIVINCIKALFCSSTGSLIKHIHYEKASSPPTSSIVQKPEWDGVLSKYKNESTSTLPEGGWRNFLFSACVKSSVVPEEVIEENTEPIIETFTNNCMPCPFCGLKRSTIHGDVDDASDKIQKMSTDDFDLSMVPQGQASNPISFWLSEPSKVYAVVPLPIDIVGKLFVLNEALPSNKYDNKDNTNKNTTGTGSSGGLQSLIYYAALDNGVSKKWPWGDEGDGELITGTTVFDGGKEALYGACKPITPSGTAWVSPKSKTIKMTTYRPLPDNFLLNRLLHLFPDIPVYADGYEVFKLIHCSPKLFVIDWTEYIAQHRDRYRTIIESGIPYNVCFGGVIPILRMSFQHIETDKNKFSTCNCSTALAMGVAFRHNDKRALESDVTCRIDMPSTFEYKDIVKSGAMRIIQSVLGKQEFQGAVLDTIGLLRNECDYLRAMMPEVRQRFLEPDPLLSQNVGGNSTIQTQNDGNLNLPSKSMNPVLPLSENEGDRGKRSSANRSISNTTPGVLLDVHDFANFTNKEKQNILTNKEHYAGTWRIIMERSSDSGPCMKALGLNYFKRTAIASHKLYHIIKLTDNKLDIKAYYPLGVVKKAQFPLDGSVLNIHDEYVGSIECRMTIENGVWISKRIAKNGVMYDNRIMYKHDPKGEFEGPLMLFRYGWKDNSGEYLINRWMKRDAPIIDDDKNNDCIQIEANIKPVENHTLIPNRNDNKMLSTPKNELRRDKNNTDSSSPSSPLSDGVEKQIIVDYSPSWIVYSVVIVYTILIHYYILIWK